MPRRIPTTSYCVIHGSSCGPLESSDLWCQIRGCVEVLFRKNGRLGFDDGDGERSRSGRTSGATSRRTNGIPLALANMMWLGFGRVAPSKAHRSAENIAYDYDSFSKTLGQWINSSGHRENLLMHGATKVGVASAKSRTTGRTYWAMVIAGDYERFRSPSPKSTRSNHDERTCRLEFVGLCLPADLSK